MKNISIIGSGQMGNGIAHVFAQSGYIVKLIDIKQDALDRALATITSNLDRQLGKGTITEEVKQSTLANISLSTDLKLAVADSDLVIEAATENVDLKLKIFADLDAFTKPSCILASNTSSISITKIASVTKRADKVIGMHFIQYLENSTEVSQMFYLKTTIVFSKFLFFLGSPFHFFYFYFKILNRVLKSKPLSSISLVI